MLTVRCSEYFIKIPISNTWSLLLPRAIGDFYVPRLGTKTIHCCSLIAYRVATCSRYQVCSRILRTNLCFIITENPVEKWVENKQVGLLRNCKCLCICLVLYYTQNGLNCPWMGPQSAQQMKLKLFKQLKNTHTLVGTQLIKLIGSTQIHIYL